MQTDRLPSLFFNPEIHEEELALSEGFYSSASDVISKYEESRTV
jgi:hypothetical protein